MQLDEPDHIKDRLERAEDALLKAFDGKLKVVGNDSPLGIEVNNAKELFVKYLKARDNLYGRLDEVDGLANHLEEKEAHNVSLRLFYGVMQNLPPACRGITAKFHSWVQLQHGNKSRTLQ